MNYQDFLQQSLQQIKREGRYRVFSQFMREANSFPRVRLQSPVSPSNGIETSITEVSSSQTQFSSDCDENKVKSQHSYGVVNEWLNSLGISNTSSLSRQTPSDLSESQALTHSQNNQNSQDSQDVSLWSTNDYLMMSHHPQVINVAVESTRKWGVGAGGTRNITGTHPLHEALEMELAHLHQKETALVFSSGYTANSTALSTLASALPNCLIFSDQKNHASIIEGIKRSQCEKVVFRHNDIDHLKSLLQQQPKERPKIIAFESVYSMDGDIAPIADMCQLAREFQCFTYLDEVHAVGIYGDNGDGVAARDGVAHNIDIIQGTLAKAFGVIGGYVAGSHPVIDFIRSCGSGFIFTTALGPPQVSAALASIRLVRADQKRRAQLFDRVAFLRDRLQYFGVPFLDNPSHITPVIIGSALGAQQISQWMLNEYGMYVQHINYPTVARGDERLRITVTPAHKDSDIQSFAQALHLCWERLLNNTKNNTKNEAEVKAMVMA